MIRMIAGACDTHTGYARETNEDAVQMDLDAGFVAVADGMGGHAAGEVASRVAIETVVDAFGRGDATVVDAIVEANEAVRAAARDGRGMPGMGCTLVVCRVVEGLLDVAWAGDSRAYLLRDDDLGRISHDHSYVQSLVDAGVISAGEAEMHPERNVLTLSVGAAPLARDNIGRVSLPLRAADRLLLCTDGLTGEMDDLWIEWLLCDHPDDAAAVQALIGAALAGGGRDNITAAVVTLGE